MNAKKFCNLKKREAIKFCLHRDAFFDLIIEIDVLFSIINCKFAIMSWIVMCRRFFFDLFVMNIIYLHYECGEMA